MDFRRPRRRPTPEAQIPLSGIAGDTLAAYVAEGLIEAGFIPTGESDWDRQKSIEARAYVNWLKREEVKNEVYMMTPEESRHAFHRRNYWEKKESPEASVEQKDSFGAAFKDHQKQEAALLAARQRAREARSLSGFVRAQDALPAQFLPRGDAYEPEPAEDEDAPPPME